MTEQTTRVAAAGSGRADASRVQRRPGLVLTIVLICQTMFILDTNVVNIALPDIQRDLGFSATGLSWVLNAYMLAFGGLLLLGGRAGDILGQRRPLSAGSSSSPSPRWPGASPPLPAAAGRPCGAGGRRRGGRPEPIALHRRSFTDRRAARAGARRCSPASPAPARRSASSPAACSPTGSPGGGCCSSTCRSGSSCCPGLAVHCRDPSATRGGFDLAGSLTSTLGAIASSSTASSPRPSRASATRSPSARSARPSSCLRCS